MMTPHELRAARQAIAPDVTQAEFASALGYSDANAYRRFENGARPIPILLQKLITVLAHDPRNYDLLFDD